MELVQRKTNATHKIVVLCKNGEHQGKSKSITVSAPEHTNEQIIEIIKKTLAGGN